MTTATAPPAELPVVGMHEAARRLNVTIDRLRAKVRRDPEIGRLLHRVSGVLVIRVEDLDAIRSKLK